VLFPTPLHLTREVEDPLSGTTARIEEYCAGSSVISIRGERTTIADYEKGELVEIDGAAGTYSVTRFERIAAAQESAGVSKRAPRAVERFELQPRGQRGVGARSGEVFEAEIRALGGERQTVEVVIDRSLTLSKDAVEVLTGAAWPMQRGPESEIALRAAAAEVATGRTAGIRYGLPIEHVVTFEIDGETLRTVNRIVRVGSELPPPELIAIPPGAREVPSPIVERERLLEELDRLPTQVQP
jgi:hypothetical protein